MNQHTPAEIKLHQKSRQMEILFAGGKRFEPSYEFLRVQAAGASREPGAIPAAPIKSGCH